MLVTGHIGFLERVGDVNPGGRIEAARSSRRLELLLGVYPDVASRFDFWPVNTSEGQNAVIGLAFDRTNVRTPDALVDTVRSILAWCLTVNMYGLDDARPCWSAPYLDSDGACQFG
jgi:hypothetical protein